jgi:hypothetical protein
MQRNAEVGLFTKPSRMIERRSVDVRKKDKMVEIREKG